MKRVKSAKIGYLITSVAILILGIALTVWPEASAITICRIAGVIILLSGIAKLYGYFSNDLYTLAFQYDLALGILTTLLGTLMAFMPQRFVDGIVIITAIYVIVNGMFTVHTAVEARKFGLARWWIILAGGCIAGLLGILLLSKPFESAAAITRLVGIALAADGIQNIFVADIAIHSKE